MSQLPSLSYNGSVIRDREEMLSLTDMWKAAGSDTARQPSNWLASAEATRFTAFIAEILNPRISGNELVHTVRGGRHPGTWAHWQIALAYAKYLSPEFHMWCNTVVRERMEQDRREEPEIFLPTGSEPLTRDQFREDLNKALKHIRQQVIEQVESRVLASLEPMLRRLAHADKAASQSQLEFAIGKVLDREIIPFKGALKGIILNQKNWREAGLLPAPIPTDETTFVTSTEVCWLVIPDAELHKDMPAVVGARLLSHARKHHWPQGETERRSRRDRPMPTYPRSRVKEWLAAGGKAFIQHENRARHAVGAQPVQGVIAFPVKS